MAEVDEDAQAQTTVWVKAKCQMAAMYAAERDNPHDPEARQRYEKNRDEAISAALSIEDELYQGFSLHQVIRMLSQAGEAERAKELFARIDDDFIREKIVEDVPELANEPKVKRRQPRQPVKGVAWYRSRSYRGNLTEEEKRKFDTLRAGPDHPAARYPDLPEEVQSYINALEMEVYDGKQTALTGRTLFFSAAAVVLAGLAVAGVVTATVWTYAGAALLLVGSWFVYWYEWRKNAEAFVPSNPDAPNTTDEARLREWELQTLVDEHRKAERQKRTDKPSRL